MDHLSTAICAGWTSRSNDFHDTILGMSSILGAIDIIATIMNMRARYTHEDAAFRDAVITALPIAAMPVLAGVVTMLSRTAIWHRLL